MLILTIVFFAGTFGLNFQLTSALMATEVFHKGAGEYGMLGTTLAIGSLTGALLAARRGRIRHRLVIIAAVVFGVAEIVAGLLPSYVAFAIWTPVIGIASLTMITVGQRDLPDERRAGDARPGDGALHDDLHGRHPDRRAHRGLGRRDLRRSLDAGRRRVVTILGTAARGAGVQPGEGPDRARAPSAGQNRWRVSPRDCRARRGRRGGGRPRLVCGPQPFPAEANQGWCRSM